MAYAPLLRTNTTPSFQPQSGGGGLSGFPANPTGRGSHLSVPAFSGSSTSLPSTLSTASPVMAQPNGGGPQATSNIINQKADASRSLYQICVTLSQRLALVPGFDEYHSTLDPMDPVDTLWALLRTGHPLLAIYNVLEPAEPLKSDDANDSEAKKTQKAVFKFIKACVSELKLSEGFMLRDLTDNDTTGFVKVLHVVNRVLDLAEQRGLLRQPESAEEPASQPGGPGQKMTQRDYVVRELVDTERKYVQDLENLHDLKLVLEQRGDVIGDHRHDIFMNINAILDFQRRFLIRIESTNSQPVGQQQWGSAFVTYEDAFDIYHQFIAGQSKASETIVREFDKIRLAEHPVAADINTLDGFLLKPMQRLTKYPLMLKTLVKNIEDEDQKAEVQSGYEAAERVLRRANETLNRRQLDKALASLVNRVDDWKNHKVEQFGKLLMHGIYGVVTGKSDAEKEYNIYLFECILLCCKEVVLNRGKDKKEKTKSTGSRMPNPNAKLQLKGRIFMTNVTDVVSISKPGSHSVQIWWKGDPGIENFTIKFPLEDTMKGWATALDVQRKENTPRTSQTVDRDDFAWMKMQQNNLPENPHMNSQQEEDDEDSPSTATNPQFNPLPSAGALARNPSALNLRQRSMTNESAQSLASVARGPPPRFPMPMPTSLSLQTQNMSAAASPGLRNGDSYFSPVAESPPSSRASTTSGMFPTPTTSYTFPRGPTEDNNRYTAPAMPRAPSRDGPSAAQYGMNGRNPRGPSLPVPPNPQSVAQLQRSRSYSTADINGIPAPRRNTHGAPPPGIPGVPAIPSYVQDSVPRSHTSSPRAADLPTRANTQSPGAQRERMHQHSGSLGGAMNHFPSQPINRQHTPNTSNGLTDVASRTASPAIGVGPGLQHNPLTSPDFPAPTQLKVKVTCDSGAYVTLVASFNITYQFLIDRIDAKLARFTTAALGKGNLRLRYLDEDGDYIVIRSDEDIQIAFTEWRDNNMSPGEVGEIQLYCAGDGA